MFRKRFGVLTSERENPQQCDACGQIRELRPYGPNGKAVCVECRPIDWEANMLAHLKAHPPSEVGFRIDVVGWTVIACVAVVLGAWLYAVGRILMR